MKDAGYREVKQAGGFYHRFGDYSRYRWDPFLSFSAYRGGHYHCECPPGHDYNPAREHPGIFGLNFEAARWLYYGSTNHAARSCYNQRGYRRFI
jgi:hypothetical protein